MSQTVNRVSFIPEIHGVRGIALLLVVLFHLFGNGRVSGGIDVFLVISGFLLMGSLARVVAANRRISLTERYARTAVRIMPAAFITILGIIIAAFMFAPETLWSSIFSNGLASLLYYENWAILFNSLAYDAAGPTANPLQHFWSLSIQGQFFLVWPLLIVLLVILSKKMKLNALKLITVFTIAATLASFVFAWQANLQDSTATYFNSFARFWEIGVGAILALFIERISIPRGIASFMAVLGIVLLIACGFILDGAGLFPGPLALWPVTSVLLVVIASKNVAPWIKSSLSAKPLTFIADISYGLYLWHWPVLIFYMMHRDIGVIGPKSALLVLITSAILAYATNKLIETPASQLLKKLRPDMILNIVLGALLVGTVALTVLSNTYDTPGEPTHQTNGSTHRAGALALRSAITGETSVGKEYYPSALQAKQDVDPKVDPNGPCTQSNQDRPEFNAVIVCDNGIENPSKTIALVGGSHVRQWRTAFLPIADEYNWRLVMMTKSSCNFGVHLNNHSIDSQSCIAWNRLAVEEVVSLAPDAVFTLATSTSKGGSDWRESYSDGAVLTWEYLQQHDIPVIAIRDNPSFAFDIPACVSSNAGQENQQCSVPRRQIFEDASPALSTDLPESFAHIDLTDYFCPEGVCQPIIGNVLVYRDKHHITKTYLESLTPIFKESIEESAPYLF